jgi:hypothetical protein
MRLTWAVKDVGDTIVGEGPQKSASGADSVPLFEQFRSQIRYPVALGYPFPASAHRVTFSNSGGDFIDFANLGAAVLQIPQGITDEKTIKKRGSEIGLLRESSHPGHPVHDCLVYFFLDIHRFITPCFDCVSSPTQRLLPG